MATANKRLSFWLNGHLIFMVFFFFLLVFFLRSFQVMLINIDVLGFDMETYVKPIYNFSVIALFFCMFTLLIGYFSYKRLRLLGGLLLSNGLVFLLLAIIMMRWPRFVNLYDVFWYWCGYIAMNIILTVAVISEYETSDHLVKAENDFLLDDEWAKITKDETHT